VELVLQSKKDFSLVLLQGDHVFTLDEASLDSEQISLSAFFVNFSKELSFDSVWLGGVDGVIGAGAISHLVDSFGGSL